MSTPFLTLPSMLRLETTQVMIPDEGRVSDNEATAPHEQAPETVAAAGDEVSREVEEDLEKIRKGKVVWMNNNIGFGFIEDIETGQEYFVHYESIIAPNPEHTQEKKGKKVPYKSLMNDESVEFRLEKEDQSDKKMAHARAKGKQLKAYKAVDVTGPNGRPVLGVRKTPDVSTASCRGRKSRGLSARDRKWLNLMPTNFTGNASDNDGGSPVRSPQPNPLPQSNPLPAMNRLPSNVSASSSGVPGYSWGAGYYGAQIVATGRGYHQTGQSPHSYVQTPIMMPHLDNGSDSGNDGAANQGYPTPFPLMAYQQ